MIKKLTIASLVVFSLIVSFNSVSAQSGWSDAYRPANSSSGISETTSSTGGSGYQYGGAYNPARPNVETLQEMIKSLTERIKQLQGGDAQGIKAVVKDSNEQMRSYIKSEFKMGTTSEQVKKIQEILASDKDIYPKGLVTGYFGPMTEEALKKFQTKFDLEVTGQINEETREAMNLLLEERFEAGSVPQGLLGAPGIMNRFVERLKDGCTEELKATGPFCLMMKKKHNWDGTNNGSASSTSATTTGMTIRESKANAAIEKAEGLIEDLEEALGDVDEGSDEYEDAEAFLTSANSALDVAQDYFDDDKFVSALSKALTAQRKARSGINVLE